MTLNLQLPKNDMLKPTITVVGVGGAGGNAVNNMIAASLEGVNFVVANTDAQALDHTLADRAVQLGAGLTKGLGAGANPDVGRAAAEEAAAEIASYIEGSNMVFITAGMGGGTGTGAAPVVARIAREQGILTVAVVTKPFQFEGTTRMRLADAGLKELQEYVDTLIIIPNQNLFRIANERTTFADAFRMADEVLHSGVRGITDLMVKPGLINLDFADIRTVMREMGKAMMGTGEATGDKRAIEAAEAAISNPLLDDVSLKGARAALINITGGPDMTLFEVDEAANRIREEVDPDANIIFGSAFSEAMEGRIRVSVVATGIDVQQFQQQGRQQMGPIEQRKPHLFNQQPSAAPRQPQAVPLMPAPRPAPEPVAERPAAPQQPVSPPVEQRAVEMRAPAPVTPRLDSTASQEQPLPEMPRAASPVLGAAMAGVGETQAVREQRFAPAPRPAPRQEAREEDEPPMRSLFSRLAEVSRSFAPRVDYGMRAEPPERSVQTERSVQVAERAKPEAARKQLAMAEEEQFLDIPAFLRRQVN